MKSEVLRIFFSSPESLSLCSVVFLAINLLDRLLGKVGHHARDVLAHHFLLLFFLVVHAVAAVAVTVLVVTMATVRILVAALAAHRGATLAGIESFLHGAAGESSATARITTVAASAARTGPAVTAIAGILSAGARTKRARVALSVTRAAVTARTAVVASRATSALLLLRLRNTGKDSGIGLEHLRLHGRLLQFGIGRHHGRCGRSGRLRDRLRIRLDSRLGLFLRSRHRSGSCRSSRLHRGSFNFLFFRSSNRFRRNLRGRSSFDRLCRRSSSCRSRGRLGNLSGLGGSGFRSRLHRSLGSRLRFIGLLGCLLEANLHTILRGRRGRGLLLFDRGLSRFGRSRLLEVLGPGVLLGLFRIHRFFDLLEFRSVHLPVYWFNLI